MSDRAIRELPRALAEKIAAGEVVSRPASVVKELMENSLDAGASSIVAEIKNGGKAMIRVTDDGSGIPSDQAETAFKRHATSKISAAEDLDSILTLGFRGEALNSIAAVSRVEMVTKVAGEKVGRRLILEGGVVTEDRPTGAADGTTVVVRDLFYNTPARLKFMKADRAEASLAIDVASNLALAHPRVRVRLVNNGNILYSTPGRGDALANILTIYGREVAEGLLPVNAEAGGMALGGYVSPPARTRSSRRYQLFFINGRAVSSRVLERAVTEAYRETVFEGRHPAAFLFLSLPPERLDVNIHPAKNEVRFDDEKLLEGFVAASIREAVLTKTAISGIRATRRGFAVPEAERRAGGGDGETVRGGVGSAPEDFGGEEGEGAGQGRDMGGGYGEGSGGGPEGGDLADIISILSAKRKELAPPTREEMLEMAIFEEGGEEPGLSAGHGERKAGAFDIAGIRPLTALFSTYVVGVDGEALYVIDQHAAHERVMYERFLRQRESGGRLVQNLLLPVPVEAPFALSEVAGGRLEAIRDLGFDLEEFGPRTFSLRGVPAFLTLAEGERFLADVLEALPEESEIDDAAAMEKLISRACKNAVKGGDDLSPEETRRLLADLAACGNPFSCPHGRPVFVRLRKRDLERLFKRA
ncbi:MAG: DNA mismatch repair endonuclease MutL [Clostridiales Family XIII bacterium]|jgi:DNA mismatch repair protein MutL|nr:DNA mismatch repair endonuclease MutL [Clostridiales Family XIII bacterium]